MRQPSPPRDNSAAPTADDILTGVDLSACNAVVTGATSGVGVGIASALAGAGTEVTLAVRDVERGQQVAADIARRLGVTAPRVEHLDLLSMASVRDFASRWGTQPLQLLINNAGVMGVPLAHTDDGFEQHMAVNFFAPFLLSELLLPNLAANTPGRVITLSSGAHHLSRLHLDDLNYHSQTYDKFEAYGHAKWCANLLSVAYTHHHRNTGVTMNVVTPGGVITNLGRHASFEDAVRLGWINEDGSLPQGEMRSVEQGAASPVWAAVTPELSGRGGLYIEDCAIAPQWAPPQPEGWGVIALSLDPNDAEQLWTTSYPLIFPAGRTP